MTVTESPPERVAEVTPAPPTPRSGGWLDTGDHKRIGLLYILASLAFLLIGGVVGVALRGELAEPGVQFLDGHYGRAFSLHATVLAVLFLPALWAGLASFVVPLQLGANRVAFPRLLALSLWLHVGGGLLMLTAYGMDRMHLPGVTLAVPTLAEQGGATTATNLWLGALALVYAGGFAAAVTFVVTVARVRPVGLTLSRVPLFAWSVLVSAGVAVLAIPAALGGLLLFFVDQHFGGHLFAAPGAAAVWQHGVWLFGRPEVFLLVLPGLGAACDIVATHARRDLLSSAAARAAIGAVGALSFTTWAAGTHVARSIVVPTYSVLTSLVVLPLGVLALVWLGTVATGRPRLHTSALLVTSAVLSMAFAALNAAIAAVVGVHGAAWTVGYLHGAVFGPAVLLGAGALYHWAPKLFGRQLPAGPGAVITLLLLGGSVLNAGGSFLLGYAGAPAHVADLVGKSSWVGFSRLAAAGGVLLALGAVGLVVEVVRAAVSAPDPAAAADPYEGRTLEWATASPPPARNFDALPPITSASPLAKATAVPTSTAADAAPGSVS